MDVFGADTPLEAISAERIDAYRIKLAGEGRLADRTINKRLMVLSAILKRAMRRYGLPANPAAAVERQPVRSSGDFDVLSPGEVAALARAAASEQDAALYIVAAFTGLRLGELRGLRWGDVDFGKQNVYVRRSYTHDSWGEPKSGRVRSVPMVDHAIRALDGLSQRDARDGSRRPRVSGRGGRRPRRVSAPAALQGGTRYRWPRSGFAFTTCGTHLGMLRRAGVPVERREGVHGPRGYRHDQRSTSITCLSTTPPTG